MGLDFIRKTAPSFHRALDRRAVELRTPKLFTRDIPLMTRAARADICHGAKMTEGERLLLRIIDDKLIAQRDNLIVAEFAEPPIEFVTQIRCGAGVGEGEVKSVQPLSQIVEIKICE